MASVFTKYQHLPGHLTEFKDGGMKVLSNDPNPPETESMLLLGTAVDGPIMEPIAVDSQTYESVFGKIVDDSGVPNGATLGQGFEEAWNAGCRDIRLMRISGSTASATIKCNAGTKKTETIYNETLGYAKGNSKAESQIKISSMAKKVLTVELSDGTQLKSENYEVIQEPVVGQFVSTTTGELANESDLAPFKYILDDEGKVVVVEESTITVQYNSETGEYRKTSYVDENGNGYGEVDLDALFEDPDTPNPWTDVISVSTPGAPCYIKSNIPTLEDGTEDFANMILNPQPETVEDAIGKDGDIYVQYTDTIVAINDEVCSAGVAVTISYTKMNNAIVTENSNVNGPYKTGGDPLEFELPDGVTPYKNLTKLYINSVEYSESDTTADGKKVFIVGEKEVTDEEGNTKTVSTITVNAGSHALVTSRFDIRFAYLKEEEYVAELKLETAYGGEIYNQTYIEIEEKKYTETLTEKIVKITKPLTKRNTATEDPLTYSSLQYPTLALLERAINNDTRNNGFVKASVSNSNGKTKTSELIITSQKNFFTGGDDGLDLTNQEMFTKLSGERDVNGYLVEQGAYQLLENYTVDYVVPLGVYADTQLIGYYDNFAYELALFCAVISHSNHATMGAISTSSPDEPTLKAIADHVEKLDNFTNEYLMRDDKGDVIKDSDNNPIDLGKHIMVLAGGDTLMVSQRLGTYAANSAAALVGYITTLDASSAPTNKSINSFGGLRIKYSNSQLNTLCGNRYVVYKIKPDGSVAIVDAMTAATSASDYQRVSTFRAVKELANQTREVADPFIGEPNTVEQRNALSAALDKRYGLLKENGVIKDYSFNLICTAYDELVGAAKIELTIVPSQELREITTVIALRPSM